MAKNSPAQRAKWNRQLRRVAARSESKARAALVREFARSAERWDAGKHESAVESIITGAYNETANASYPTAQAMLKGKQARKTVDEARVSWLIGVKGWVQQFAKSRSRQIARESQRIVTKAVSDAAAAGEGQEGGAKRILAKLSGSIGRSRARTIARTEIGAAQNMAVFQAAQASGIEYELTWCAAEDERTRASHSAADGQTVKEGESFKVGDAFLDRPGDPSGPGAEVINCRCTVLIEPVLPEDEIEEEALPPPPASPVEVVPVKAKVPAFKNHIEANKYVQENDIAEQGAFVKSNPIEGIRDVVQAMKDLNERFDWPKMFSIGNGKEVAKLANIRNTTKARGWFQMSGGGHMAINDSAYKKYEDSYFDYSNQKSAEFLEQNKTKMSSYVYAISQKREYKFKWTIHDQGGDGTAIHEGGHKFHTWKYIECEQAITGWNKDGWGFLISRYGTQDKYEFIAESFSLYIRHPDQHWRIKPELLKVFKDADKSNKN
jgi:SPP1 gp7 family putative phage head morphogenesis protein